MKWLIDRKYTVTGIVFIFISALFFVKQQWFGGIGIPVVFGNVLINTILMLGITILKYGLKNDKFKKDISEI
jgi:hypothetical protein